MKLTEFKKEYNLYGSIITSWDYYAENHRLVWEVDLSNLNQQGYVENDPDFREVIIVFNNCSFIDTLDQGFDGFTDGDGRIIAKEWLNEDSLKILFMHDLYNGESEKLVSIIISSSDIFVTDRVTRKAQ
jgi:hypothetical protein